MLHKPTVCSVFVSLLYGQSVPAWQSVSRSQVANLTAFMSLQMAQNALNIFNAFYATHISSEILRKILELTFWSRITYSLPVADLGEEGQIKKIAEEKKAGRASDTKPDPLSLRFASAPDYITKQFAGQDQYLERMWRHLNSIQTVFKLST